MRTDPNLRDQIANPVPEPDSARWLEQELLAMAPGLVDQLRITVCDDKTLVEGMDKNRTVFMRATIPRVFPGLSNTGWLNIKRGRFDKVTWHLIGFPTINLIPWTNTLDMAVVAAVVAQATDEFIPASALGLEGDHVAHLYGVAPLKRLLRKKPTAMRIFIKGVLGAEVIRNDITYEYLCRSRTILYPESLKGDTRQG